MTEKSTKKSKTMSKHSFLRRYLKELIIKGAISLTIFIIISSAVEINGDLAPIIRRKLFSENNEEFITKILETVSNTELFSHEI